MARRQACAGEPRHQRQNREDDEETTTEQPPCRKVGPNLENQRVAGAGARKSAPLRGGAAKSCAAPGQLGSNDDAIYFCFTVGDDGATWTYLENQRPPKRRGWVRNDQLRVNRVGTRGSTFYCGF